MADTYLGECKECGTETDLINGICMDCSSKEGGNVGGKKTLKELLTIRDALKDLIVHNDWFGPTDILHETLAKAEKEIEERTGGGK
ncbi:MAG TPA: hypothetical protein ENH85_12585 [Candidatus Scalindua sp.]|nr:hypothetical protein [Candidatus Scalindua sp.]